jgi:hypothetical protein
MQKRNRSAIKLKSAKSYANEWQIVEAQERLFMVA